jgi:hypothetical protein
MAFLQQRKEMLSCGFVIAAALIGVSGSNAVAGYSDVRDLTPATEHTDSQTDVAATLTEQPKTMPRSGTAGLRPSNAGTAPPLRAVQDSPPQSGEDAQKTVNPINKNDLSLGIVAVPPWMSNHTPAVDSPQWKREQDESAKEEQHIQHTIDGVCRSC